MMSERVFKVKLKGMAGLLYMVRDRSMSVDSEMLFGPDLEIAIEKQSIQKWNPPHSDEVLTDEERRQILINIVTYFENLNYKVYVSPSY